MADVLFIPFILLTLSAVPNSLCANTLPVFVNDMNNYRIPEDTLPGSAVYNLTAYDAETEVYYGIDKTDVFYADPITGVVDLIRALDYEIAPILHFVTVVEDLPVNDSQANTVSHPVTVYVIDVNDNEPRFSNLHPLEIRLTPDLPVGSPVGFLKASDIDTVGDPLTVTCVPTILQSGRDLCEFFAVRHNSSTNPINFVTAEISLAAPITDLYALKFQETEITFSVSDGLHKSTTQVHVAIDKGSGKIGTKTQHSPQSFSDPFPSLPAFLRDDQHVSSKLKFDPPVGLIEILENWPVSFPLPFRPRLLTVPNSTVTLTVKITSPSTLENAFQVQPTSVNDSEFIQIMPTKAAATDRESYPTEIRLEVIASDSSVASSAVLPITIRLLDINDNAPTFRKSVYNFTMSDDAEDNQHVGTLEATDPDSDQFGVEGLTYSILGPWAKYFRPVTRRSDTVEIHTSIPKSLSLHGVQLPWRRLPETIVLVVRVTDTNGTGLYSDTPVVIHLVRAEKHAPVFVSGNHFARLREKSVQLEPPLVLQAYDPDGSALTYTLDDPTGHVFGIDAHTGVIFVAYPEDVSIVNLGRRLHLTALVSDGVHSSVKTNVTIELTEINKKQPNQPPKFLTPSFNFIVSADASHGFVVGNVIAEDPEGTIVKYQLANGGEGNFILDTSTGELSWIGDVVSKDQIFLLTVLAADAGNPPAVSTVQLRITVKGRNTVDPKFTDTVFTAYLSENATIGTDVLALKIIDPDANGLYSFSIKRAVAFDHHGYNVLFAPDGNDLSGFFAFRDNRMILRKPLYDTELSSFHMQISCNDLMHPLEQPAYTLAVVNIVPVTKPRIYTYDFVGVPHRHASSQSSEPETVEVTVPSDVESGGFIYQFHVIEIPPINGFIKPAPVTFKMANNSEFFSIDSTGVVKATKSLLKAPERSVLLIEVSNSRPGRLRTANLVVNVVKPIHVGFAMLTSHFDIRLSEDARPGSFVLQTNNTAVDSALIRYNLTGPNADVFSVDNKGVVTLATLLDYEKKSALAFIVEAMLLSENNSIIGHATALVAVTVLDANDNAPQFENDTYFAIISESIPVNSYITYVHAKDADSGENGTVSYRLANVTKEIADYINIDAVEGILLTNRLLVGHAGQYRFYVVATDGGGLNSTATMNLVVQPVSHCQPVWSRSTENNTIMEIQENLPAGQLVGIVQTVTKHEKCKVKYTFLDSSTGQATGFTNEFELDADSGRITTRVMLDREKQSNYRFVIIAKDSEPGNLFSVQTVVQIFVKDVNDNIPVFEAPTAASIECETGDFSDCWRKHIPKTYNFSIFENEPIGTVLGILRASDRDDGENARIYYHLSGGPDMARFSLDSVNGTLSTKESFDYESTHSLEAIAVATNSLRLTPSEKSSLLANISAPNVVLISVQILDRNDHGPVFDREVYLAAISNETTPETLVALVHAIDPDTTGGSVYYRLRKTSYHYKKSAIIEQNVFSVNSVEGQIRTKRQIGHYSQGYFQLTIDSSNAENYTTNLSDTTYVKIWIYNPEQLVRIVIKDTPINISDHADIIAQELGNTIGAYVILQRIEYNKNVLGLITSDRVDLLAIFVDRSTEEIMEISRVLTVVDRQGLLLTAASRPDLGLVQILPAQLAKEKSSTLFSAASIALVVFGCIMFISLLGFLLLMCYFRYSYIKEAKVAPIQKQEISKSVEPQFVLPRKMKENPLWNEVDKKPYEEQEISMPVSFNNVVVSNQLSKEPNRAIDNAKKEPVKEVASSYAVVHKEQPSHSSTRTSVSCEDYYQTLETD